MGDGSPLLDGFIGVKLLELMHTDGLDGHSSGHDYCWKQASREPHGRSGDEHGQGGRKIRAFEQSKRAQRRQTAEPECSHVPSITSAPMAKKTANLSQQHKSTPTPCKHACKANVSTSTRPKQNRRGQSMPSCPCFSSFLLGTVLF